MSQKIINFVNAHVSQARAIAPEPLDYTPHILVIRDTSGSNAVDEFIRQATFSDEIARTVPAAITYASADTTIRQTLTKNPGEPLRQYEHLLIDECGHGGTDMFQAVAAGLAHSDTPYDAVVVISDGYTQPASMLELQTMMAKLGGEAIAVPPIAFSVTQNDGTNNSVAALTQHCTGYPTGAFMTDFIEFDAVAPSPTI